MTLNLNRIYFPLRSNVDWFQSATLRSEMEDRLKEAILLYDELIIEDGTYESTILEDFIMDGYIPPSMSQHSDRIIDFENDIENNYVEFRAKPVDSENEYVSLAAGKTVARHKVDFYEIISQLDLTAYDFIRLAIISDNRLPEEIKSIIAQQTEHDQRTVTEYDNNRFLKNLILKNLNRDLIISHMMGTGILIDPTHAGLLEVKSRQSLKGLQFMPDKEAAIMRTLFKVKVPNFRNLTLEQVIELRHDKLWEEFRTNVRRISELISNDPDVLINSYAFNDVVRNAVDMALFEEIEKREKNGLQLTTDLVFGGISLIPVPPVGMVVSGLSAIKSLADFYNDRNGWITFLVKASKLPPQT